MEQSDLGLHCLPFCQHLFHTLGYSKIIVFKFKDNYTAFFGSLNLTDF